MFAVSPIVGLHLGCSPPAIVGTVRPFIIDAVNAQISSVAVGIRPISKGRETVVPLRTDSDPSSGIARMLAAAFPQIAPDAIKAGVTASVAKAPDSRPLFPIAATGLRFAITKATSCRRSLVPTIAKAAPSDVAETIATSHLDDDEPSKPLAFQISNSVRSVHAAL